MSTNQPQWRRMQILAEQLGYRYSGLQSDNGQMAIVLVSQDSEDDLVYRGATVADAVDNACLKLAIVVGCKEDATS
jgi:hypothetical protein